MGKENGKGRGDGKRGTGKGNGRKGEGERGFNSVGALRTPQLEWAGNS